MLFQAFMSSDVIRGLMVEHTSTEPVIIQKLDVRAKLPVLLRNVDVERIYATL